MSTSKILVCFGGISAEHEVSIITGLQVVENIDRSRYEPYVVYCTALGEFFLLKDVKKRRDFTGSSRVPLTFGRDARGGFMKTSGLRGIKLYPDCAYMAFHGGSGECGQMQGLMESLGIPYTSPTVEGSVITMNKMLTKEVLKSSGVPVLEATSVKSDEILADSQGVVRSIIEKVRLPVIIKPVHLGSSIGIAVAKTDVELEKRLLESAHVDSEILVETFLSEFVELNCAVRRVEDKLEVSEIERPISRDEILSFADKYQRGGKKSGGGMASLDREIPAKIGQTIKEELQELARKAFALCRCKGMVRVDFMLVNGKELYVTEINPIPGSMSYYLWEASGVSFTQQITDIIEQAIRDYRDTSGKKLEYSTDIVETFVKG